MKRLIALLVSAIALLLLAPGIHSQDLLVPAGTLLQCTMDEPNFSSATATVGDPVLCHLRSQQEFGRQMFPRGSMLGGHLEADKEPGHFVGKGYLKITFDRVIMPAGDVPVPAKVIQARGYKVDKQGDIDGKGHAKRDVVEWMFPPLWPWKVISLPMRGPRPTLKGEEPLQLRLMDDIVIPRSFAQMFYPDRPPYATGNRPVSYEGQSQVQANPVQLAVQKTGSPVGDSAAIGTSGISAPAQSNVHYTVLALKSNQVIEVAKYRREGDTLNYLDMQGNPGSVAMNDVDWKMTTEMTAKGRSAESPILARQLN